MGLSFAIVHVFTFPFCECVLRNTITSFLGEEFGDLYAAKRGGVEKAEPRAGA